MTNERAMFAMGLPGGMREFAPVADNTPPRGASAPEISLTPKSDSGFDQVVVELKALAGGAGKTARQQESDCPDDDGTELLPPEDAALGFSPPPVAAGGGAGRSGTRLSLATLGSLLIHGTALAFAVHVAGVLPEAVQEEGSTLVSIVMIGNGDVDAAASGGEEPEVVQAEPVEVENVQALEAEPLETVAPPDQAVPLPPEETPSATAETVVQSLEPEVLAVAPTDAAAPSVAPPAAAVPVEAVPPDMAVTAAAPVAAEPLQAEAATAPVVAQTTQSETIKAQEDDPELAYDIAPPMPAPSPWKTEPLPQKQVEARKVAEAKKPVTRRASSAGSSGQSNRDARKGAVTGTSQKGSTSAAQAQAGGSGKGKADMANYAGKVGARLRRSVASQRYYRGIDRLQATVVVNVTLNRSGGISALSLSKSSGNGQVDAIVMQRARAAGPFGAFPASYAGASHSFRLPIRLDLGR